MMKVRSDGSVAHAQRDDGVYLGMSRADYDAIDAVNWSWLKHMKRSALHFATAKTEAEKDTDALRQGRAVHVATLEPDRFVGGAAPEWIVWEGGKRNSNAWRDFEADAKSKGLEILTAEQYQDVMGMVTAVHGHKKAKEYLLGGRAEVTIVWTYEEPANGLPGFKIRCKSRLDIAKDRVALADLKSTRDAAREAFARQAWNLDYYAQLAMYQDAWASQNEGVLLPFKAIAVENTSPHVVQVYRVGEHLLSMGRDTYRELLRKVADCRAAGVFEGYGADDEETDLDLPSWARTDETDLTGLGLEVGEAVQ